MLLTAPKQWPVKHLIRAVRQRIPVWVGYALLPTARIALSTAVRYSFYTMDQILIIPKSGICDVSDPSDTCCDEEYACVDGFCVAPTPACIINTGTFYSAYTLNPKTRLIWKRHLC